MPISQVLILDDPAAGLDIEARKMTWNLLKKFSVGRTILLSTHYVDEADYILDRVAFLVEGRLRCCDTPSSLKLKYGEITIVFVAINFTTLYTY